MWKRLIALFYPRRCPVCRGIVVPRGELICPECRKKLHYIKEPACMRCGRQLENEEQEYCSECQKKRVHYHRGYAVWQYDDAMKQSLADFKYHARKEFADFYIAEAVRLYGEKIRREAPQVLIPVPIHRSRRRERGFNQAELLAKGIGAALGIAVDTEYLKRVKKTKALKQLNAKEREAALKDAFEVLPEQMGKNYQNVMLIDDIYTTGSTIEKSTQALKKAGVKQVSFLCMAIGADFG